MSTHRVLVTFEATLHDPTWTLEDLRDNAVGYIGSAIQRAEESNRQNFGPPAYTLDVSDITMYAPETDYLLDLEDLAALSPENIVVGLQKIEEDLR